MSNSFKPSTMNRNRLERNLQRFEESEKTKPTISKTHKINLRRRKILNKHTIART